MNSPFKTVSTHTFIAIQPRYFSQLPQPNLIKRCIDIREILLS